MVRSPNPKRVASNVEGDEGSDCWKRVELKGGSVRPTSFLVVGDQKIQPVSSWYNLKALINSPNNKSFLPIQPVPQHLWLRQAFQQTQVAVFMCASKGLYLSVNLSLY